MELPKTFDQFMEKFGDKDAKDFEEILKAEYSAINGDLNYKFCICLWDNFCSLPEEEKLKFTIEQAEKIKNDKFVEVGFHYITVSEMKISKLNANKKLCEFAKKICSKLPSYILTAGKFLLYCFSNSFHDLSECHIELFSCAEVEFLFKYKDFFTSYLNELLKQKYVDFECGDFLLEMEQNPQNVFDYLAKKTIETSYEN